MGPHRRVLSAGMVGDDVAALHQELVRLGYPIPAAELTGRIFGIATARAVGDFQRAHALLDTAIVDEATHAAIQRLLAGQRPGEARPAEAVAVGRAGLPHAAEPQDAAESLHAAEPSHRAGQLYGRVTFDHGQLAAHLTLHILELGFAGRTRRLAEVVTAPDGSYAVDLPAAGLVGLLEVRAVAANGAEVTLTYPGRPAAQRGMLNLVAPAARLAPLRAEHERMMADLSAALGGGRLAEAHEGAGRADLTLLRQATGWDARLIALGTLAERLAPTTGISAVALYGMLRTGLPATPRELAMVGARRVERALTRAAAANLVSLTAADIQQALAGYATFAAATRRVTVVPGTLHSQGQMLALAGLSAADQDRFGDLYAEHAWDSDALWAAVQRAGLPTQRLRVVGRLGQLTLNNAALTDWLQRRLGVDTVAHLPAVMVEQGLYRAERWQEDLSSLAQRTAGGLDAVIPPAYSGATAQERATAYATDLARKIRLAYPTQVTAQMIASDELSLAGSSPAPSYPTVKAAVVTVLNRAVPLGYQIGAVPAGPFLRQHASVLFAGMSADGANAATRAVKTLHRLYQITPSDHALKVLLDNGFSAARDVTAMPYQVYTDSYSGQFRNKKEADLVYRKAAAVTAATYAFFGLGVSLDATPPTYAAAPAPSATQAAKNKLIEQFPTLETLLGSLDFCECEHCRSVLSPAAYLVDLLHFVDPKPKSSGQTPYQVLITRRPDLPYIPLTCENTNTVLPYIDVANEIMEYYLVHKGLDAKAAYDTGTAESADLIAEPQRVLSDAYNGTLRTARYPMTLPFDLWVETVRRFFDHFGTPLWSVLDSLRPTDALYAAPTQTYAWADIFTERLGLIPDDVDVLTPKDALLNWPELYGYSSAQQALSELASAKTLARRLGVSYRELVELVRTWFVNPRLGALAVLRKLATVNNVDLDLADVLRYEGVPGYPAFSPAEKAAFEAMLTPAGLAWLSKTWAAGDFAHMLVLADPDAGCNFEKTILRYANGTPADPLVFVTLNLLVRLWRRLGWSIGETDRALRVFLPSTPDPRTAATLGPAMRTALLGIAHLDALATDLEISPKRRPNLLDLWADLSDQRYTELFLTPRVLADDPIFDHPLGQYLCVLQAGNYVPFGWNPALKADPATGNVPLSDHLGAVQGVLKLTTDDITAILKDTGTSLANAPLNVATLSILDRYGLLAKALKVSVADLVVLKAVSGLNPFTRASTAPVLTLADDHPYHETLMFAQAVAAVKASGLSVADLDYLLRHEFDPVGPYRTAAAAPLGLVRALAAEMARIRAEHPVPAEPLDFTDEVMGQKLSLILPADVAETFLGMWTGTVSYHASKANVAAGDALDPQDFANAPAIMVEYDAVSHEQRLTYRGVLVDAVRTALVAAHPQPLVAELLAAVAAQAKEFFAAHLQVSVVGVEPVGFLAPADFDTLFTPLPAGPEATVQALQRARRQALAGAFLPYLQQRLIRAAVFRLVTAELGSVEPGLVELLAADPALLYDRAYPGQPLLAAFAAADTAGLTTISSSDSLNIDGYVEVAEDGDYRFFVWCEHAGSTIELRLEPLTDPLVQAVTTAAAEEHSDYTALRAGVAYRLTLIASGLSGGSVVLQVQGEHLPKGSLDRLRLFPATGVERIRRAYTLLGKVGRIATGTDLTGAELSHMLLHRADFDKIDLSWLPTGSKDDKADHITILFGQLGRVWAYRALRRELDAEPADLLDVVTHARRTYPATAAVNTASAEVLADLGTRFGRVTRREPATVGAAAKALGIVASTATVPDGLEVSVPGFADEHGLSRMWTVMRLATALGVTPDALTRWATPRPDEKVARDLRDTVKAQYQPESWRRVAQPIFDQLRKRRRDALVAYLVHSQGLERMEQLFEVLLIDPGMEPVVQTSRVRLAISSVQLFIQRCLLNLEPGVLPTAINAPRWQWMKRYRVWEANRKIFLYPENWLEPEFRDDKTHLFTELESTLLQDDVSDDLAEEALVGYLHKLEELAHLDLRAMCLQERDDPAANVLHVVARTHSVPHKYFYRSYSRRSWTPWVPVTADIEGDHLVLLVWRERVHLFWVTFLDKAETGYGSPATPRQMADTPSLRPPRRLQVQLSWSEYYQGQWSARASGGFDNPVEVPVDPSFDTRDALMHATIEDDGSVRVHLNHVTFPTQLAHAFRVVSRYSAPTVAQPADPYPKIPYSADLVWGRYSYDGELSLYLLKTITDKAGVHSEDHDWVTILNQSRQYTFTTSTAPSTKVPADLAPLVSPFFLADEGHAFYVEPVVTETTVSGGDDWLGVKPPNVVEAPQSSQLDIYAQQPSQPGPPEPDPAAAFQLLTSGVVDWLTMADAVTHLDGTAIGAAGAVVPGQAAGALGQTAGGPVQVHMSEGSH